MRRPGKTLEEVIEVIQAPMWERIIYLEKKIKKLEDQNGFEFKINNRAVIRRKLAAGKLGIHPTTLDGFARDPLCAIESVKRGGAVYIYLDSIEAFQQQISK